MNKKTYFFILITVIFTFIQVDFFKSYADQEPTTQCKYDDDCPTGGGNKCDENCYFVNSEGTTVRTIKCDGNSKCACAPPPDECSPNYPCPSPNVCKTEYCTCGTPTPTPNPCSVGIYGHTCSGTCQDPSYKCSWRNDNENKAECGCFLPCGDVNGNNPKGCGIGSCPKGETCYAYPGQTLNCGCSSVKPTPCKCGDINPGVTFCTAYNILKCTVDDKNNCKNIELANCFPGTCDPSPTPHCTTSSTPQPEPTSTSRPPTN